MLRYGMLDASMSDGLGAPDRNARLARMVLDGESLTRLTPMLENDRAQAVADLQAENRFATRASCPPPGPYTLHLSIYEGRLVFDIRRVDDTRCPTMLALGAVPRPDQGLPTAGGQPHSSGEEGREARIQAIDMGRRGLHNEGAELMMRRLEGKVDIDFETARRLFTLLCVLHQRI